MEQAIRGRGDSRLRDLAMMTEFAHTGPNEALNALRNKASKVVRFYYGGVLVEGGSMGHLLILIKLINSARDPRHISGSGSSSMACRSGTVTIPRSEQVKKSRILSENLELYPIFSIWDPGLTRSRILDPDRLFLDGLPRMTRIGRW